MKNILITGGAGFIGSHLQDAFIERGDRVFIVDNLSTGDKENLNPQSMYLPLDILSKDALKVVFAEYQIDMVFHYAAQISVRTSFKDPAHDAQTNIVGTLNMLELSKKYGVKKFIFASTGGVMYGDEAPLPTPESQPPAPWSPYAVSKLAAEKYVHWYQKEYDLNTCILRLANVYGPRQKSDGEAGVVSIFSNLMLDGKNPTIFGTGEQTRDYIHIDDVVAANLLVGDSNISGEIFHVSTGEQTSVNEIFDQLNIAVDNKFERQYKELPYEEQKSSCLDFGKMNEELHWEPKIAVKEGLKKTFESFAEKHKSCHNTAES